MKHAAQEWAALAYFCIAAVFGFGYSFSIFPSSLAWWELAILAEIPMVAIVLMYFPDKARKGKLQ